MGRRDFFREQKIKKVVTTSAVTLLMVIIACVTVFVMYSKSLDKQAKDEYLAITNEKNDIVSNDDIQATSSSKDKTVKNNVANETTNNVNIINNTVNNTNEEKKSKNENTQNTISKEVVTPIVTPIEKNNKTENNIIDNNLTSEIKELDFQAPVEGEILKDFAMDTLVYSQTLGEWCTHSGIDIKAKKTSIVVASESGIIESIKNDPRYGLTIIIKHDNGFKTVYSNLLTTEFVKEGENVEKGQTIATVGDTASFEALDESHLHFEIYKDDIAVNPTIYLK